MKKVYTIILSILSFYFASAQNPVANFSPLDTAMCPGSCINFTNLSTNATSWQWTFSGAFDSLSTDQNPINICYLIPGTYNVTLIAINGSKRDTLTSTNAIVVYPSPPVPDITESYDTLFCSYDASYTSYQWYSNSSLIPGATSDYLVINQNGNYNVLVTNVNGCRIAVGINFFDSSYYYPPVSYFNTYDTVVCANSCIAFNNFSYYGTSYQWYFPGGVPSSSVETNPQSVCYATQGTYNVTLIATNSLGSDTLTLNNYINVDSALVAPVVTQSNDTLFCSTNPAYTSYQWYLNNYIIQGATDTFLVVSTPGIYSPRVSSSSGCNNSAQIIILPPPVIANFTAMDSEFCSNGCTTFFDYSTNANGWIWNFPGGNPSSSNDEDPYVCYSSPGTYNVTLIALNDSSADSLTLYNFITVLPGLLPPVITQSHDTLFCTTDTSYISYQWTLNDSLIASPNNSFVIITNNGNYSVWVSNVGGCEATASYYYTTLSAIANFSVNDSVFCPGDLVIFTNLSQNAGSYQWFFPGSMQDTSSAQNPEVFTYSSPGSYNVTLIASNNFSSDTLTLTNLITVYPSPPTPEIMQSHDTLFCSADPSYVSYQWYIYDTLITGATDSFLVITYSGPYNVQVTNTYNCNISAGINVRIGTNCSANFTIAADTAQMHHYIVTNNATGTPPITYYWSWGDGTHDTIPYPTHTYADSGFYTICLTITDSTGCTNTYCDSAFHAMRNTNTMVSMTVVPGMPTGLQAFSPQTPQVTIYPNPATDQLNIHFSSIRSNETVTVSIINVLGQEALSSSLSFGEGRGEALDISKLSTGIYFVKMVSESGSWMGKFVKEK